MSKKLWRLIFIVFVVVVIVSVTIILVLRNKEEILDDNTSGDNHSNDNDSVTETYATAFNVNLPSVINLNINAKIEFSNYITVTPSNKISELTYEITSKNSNADGLIFSNNILTATKVDEYTLKFKMPKSKQTFFTKSIKICVYEDETESHIYQTKKSMSVGENLNITEIFSINSSLKYEIKTDVKTKFQDNKLLAQEIGESAISISFTDNTIKYIYNFKILIKDKPEYVIHLINVKDNTINIDLSDNDVYFINYQVKNREEQCVEQEIITVSENSSIASIKRIDDVLIKIVAKSHGETYANIMLEMDERIFVRVKIIVE